METSKRATVQLPETLHPEQRINLPLVEALTGNRRTWIYGAVAAGRFPQPDRDGPRCSRWRAGDVLDWLKQRRECLPTADDARPRKTSTAEKSRAAAAALACKLVADLTAKEMAAWEAAGRPGRVVLGAYELVPYAVLQHPPPAAPLEPTQKRGPGRPRKVSLAAVTA